MYAELSPASKASGKKYTVRINSRHISFGLAGASDFTMHKDTLRKRAYLRRHSAREDWTNPLTAGFWSRWLLWEKPTIRAAIDNIKKKFNINITLKR